MLPRLRSLPLLLAGASACSHASPQQARPHPDATTAPMPSAETPATPLAPLTLGRSDAGRTVSLQAGQPLVVTLPSNPSTGYDWHVVTDAPIAPPVVERFAGDGRGEGAAGTTRLTWSTRAWPARVELRLEYRPRTAFVYESLFELTVVTQP